MKISKNKFFSMLEKGKVKNFKIGNSKFYASVDKEEIIDSIFSILFSRLSDGDSVAVVLNQIRNGDSALPEKLNSQKQTVKKYKNEAKSILKEVEKLIDSVK